MIILLSLAKPRYHLSYAGVVTAALACGPPLDTLSAAGSLGGRLLALFLSFSVLFYTGVYILNDVTDARADAADPRKRKRPIPSGEISIRNALLAATTLMAAGLLSAVVMFNPPLVAAYVGAFALNAAYSGGGRNLAYLDIVLNSAPHAVRFLMGALLVDRVPPVRHVASWFCLAVSVACLRRIVELETGGFANRPTLNHYSPRGLSLAVDMGLLIMIGLCVLDRLHSPGFYIIVTSAYLVGRIAPRFRAVHGLLGWLWLR